MTEPADSTAAPEPAREEIRTGIPPVMIFFLAIVAMVATGLVAVTLMAMRDAARFQPLPVIAEVPEFSLTSHEGETVTRADFEGRPWIADFIFTRCPAICPRMTQQMIHVAKKLPAGSPVHIASFSVDPEHDTPEVLAEFARAQGAGGALRTGDWLFLTGDVETIDSLTVKGFLMPVDRSPPPEAVSESGAIIHSSRFVLVDGEAKIRGYYDPFDEAEIERLLGDVRRLVTTRY